MTGKISENFSWEEFEASIEALEYGIDNTIPNENIAMNIRSLVVNVLQPLRTAMGKPLNISSGYRCNTLNKAIGGAKGSQHIRGEAADLIAPDPLLLAQMVQKKKLPFDQMILHSDFVHISHKFNQTERGQILYDKSYTQNYPMQ